MPKYIAFLRAINVGGHTVKMDHLRRLFEAMDFANVETFIASGNVIFESTEPDKKALERQIEESLQAALGYAVATFIRTTAELGEIARHKPFQEPDLNADGNMLYIAFLADTPAGAARQKLLSFSNEVDEFQLNGREVYWLSRRKLGDSQFSGALLEKTLGLPATVRNSNTVKKMAAKYS
ncbi:MAG: DUF1697 domain-containing protein [Anaerolineales bacterium]|nr:DUF1697 domain-containing protein [Anaerolineales bacterium]